MLDYLSHGSAAFGEIAAVDSFGGGTAEWYFSTSGYTSQSGDTPPYRHMPGRLTQPITWAITLSTAGGVVEGLQRQSGTVRVTNRDGALDPILTQWGTVGHRVTCRLGQLGWSYASFGTVFSGRIEAVEANADDELEIRVGDVLSALDAPIQSNFYTGAGGVEGGDDLAGKPKPLAYGEIDNVPAVLVDAATLTYQVHDGPIDGIRGVFDDGVALTVAAGSPAAAGEYLSDDVNGTFTLGAAPAGIVTVDLGGDASAPGHVNTTADLVRRILFRHAGLDESDLDSASFSALTAAQPAVVGLYLATTPIDISTVVDRLLSGVSAWGGFDRLGKFRVGRLDEPSGAIAAVFSDVEIESLARRVMNPQPFWRTTVGYLKCWSVNTAPAASTNPVRRDFLSQEYREAIANDATIQTAYPAAVDAPILASTMISPTDAQTEAARLLALYGLPRVIVEIVVSRSAWALSLGDVVQITYQRYGLESGQVGSVVGIVEDAAGGRTTLSVFMER